MGEGGGDTRIKGNITSLYFVRMIKRKGWKTPILVSAYEVFPMEEK